MNEQEIINTIMTEHQEEIQNFVEYRKATKVANKRYMAAAQNDEDEVAAEAAGERNWYSNEADRIKMRIDSHIRKLTGSQWLTGFWEIIWKTYGVS